MKTINAQNLAGVWQYNDSNFAKGISHYVFHPSDYFNRFIYYPNAYDDLISISKICGKYTVGKDSIRFYVDKIYKKSISEVITRRNKKQCKEKYYDTVSNNIKERILHSSTNYWQLKNNEHNIEIDYQPALFFKVPYKIHQEGTYVILEIEGDKFYKIAER